MSTLRDWLTRHRLGPKPHGGPPSTLPETRDETAPLHAQFDAEQERGRLQNEALGALTALTDSLGALTALADYQRTQIDGLQRLCRSLRIDLTTGGSTERWRHVETGDVYRVVTRATQANGDGQIVVVYRNEATGFTWCRPAAEFDHDGRLERMPP